MPTIIEIGQVYYLDGKIPVTVIKPLNRSMTFFCIEMPNNSLESVETERLHTDAKSWLDVIKNTN